MSDLLRAILQKVMTDKVNHSIGTKPIGVLSCSLLSIEGMV
jgi:hypothetical protein